MSHRIELRVYHEDTDLAGIVYYANYLKYIERARSEWIRELGVDQVGLRREAGMVFAVRRLVADYLRPARFDDVLAVTTQAVSASGARILLAQVVWRDGSPLFVSQVTLACLTASGQPTRLPAALRRLIAAPSAS